MADTPFTEVRFRCGAHLVPTIYQMVDESETGKVEVSRDDGQCHVCEFVGRVYRVEMSL